LSVPDYLPPERHRLVRKLESIAPLSDTERQALLALPVTVQIMDASTAIVRDGQRSQTCCLILDGFVCRCKSLPDGRRQIMSFHTPGDIADLQGLTLNVADHSVSTLVPTRVGLIPHESLHELMRRYPGVAAAFWRDTLVDGAIFRAWLINIGRRTVQQRIAHLLCEMTTRCEAVGLSHNSGYELPLRQSDIADALGLSRVQVNRVLRELGARGLIRSQDSTIAALDWEGLKQAGEFDPTYLHLSREEAA
jgi:CRP-like cAMP-binding protein